MSRQLSKREATLPRWWSDSPLTDMRREMDQLMSRFFGDGADMAGDGLMSPRLDLSETDKEVEVRLDLPGFRSDDIQVNLDRDLLTISGEHKEEKEEKENGRRYHRIERRHGSFHRVVQLPSTVKEDKIDASFKDGVLTVKLPKAEESKAKRIPVKG